ncbi:MAG: nucleotidyltransferase [Clostridiales bacterium]|nr:nucleotidyltransferase [Clostridiales bacterium]
MKILGIIAEYNPFHNGHEHHLKQSIKITEATHTIAIMSGNFVQRGEPALMDKWIRAKTAIDNGINLVVELPIVNAISSAEKFAHGSIHLLNQMGIVDDIVFGSESGDLSLIEKTAEFLSIESNSYKAHLKNHLNNGVSFPSAREMALQDIGFSNNNLKSNDILGIEYIKAIRRLNSPISYHLLKRESVDYHSLQLVNSFASATGIRQWIKNDDYLSVRSSTPPLTYQTISEYSDFIFLEDFYEILRYKVLSAPSKELSEIYEITEGLENRIFESMKISTNMESFINSVKIKRFTMTRIKRVLLNILLDLKAESVSSSDLLSPQYIRILGADEKGLEILRKLKENENLSVITNLSKFKTENPLILEQLRYDILASDLYSIIKKEKLGQDYYRNPYIKKNK